MFRPTQEAAVEVTGAKSKGQSSRSTSRCTFMSQREARALRLLNLNKAHTTITRDRQPAVVAESWDINADDLTCLQSSKSLGDLDGVSIDEDFDGIFKIREVDTGPTHRGPRREICGGFGRAVDAD
ncbi:hypothetical protein ACFX1Z_037901 [Malus domestica]